jgi:competence protein ComEC
MAAAKRQTHVVRLRAGETIDLDGRTRVEVLWPDATAATQPALSTNDTALVLRVTCDGRSVLLPADVDVVAERRLISAAAAAGAGELLRADVLVLPHHGSWKETLPQFFGLVSPRYVLVSNARDRDVPASSSPPLREFASHLKTAYRYYSTAQNGCVRVRFGAGGIEVLTTR